MPEKESQIYRLSEGVLSVGLEDENILLATAPGKYFGVKGAMRHLLEDLRGGLTMEDMLERTLARYDVSREEAQGDLAGTLPRLVQAGIVEPAA
jgi:hypothetical protein